MKKNLKKFFENTKCNCRKNITKFHKIVKKKAKKILQITKKVGIY